MGKLLFSCSVPSLSATLRKTTERSVSLNEPKAASCPHRPVQQQLIDAGVDQQGGVSGLSANPGPGRDAADGAAFAHHQALGFG